MIDLPYSASFVKAALLDLPGYSNHGRWVDPNLDTAVLLVLHKYNARYFTTGSRVICDPPVEGTDLDVVVCLPQESDNERRLVIELGALGFRNPERGDPDYGMSNLRKGDVNLILATPDNYELWKRATAVCTYLNVKDRETRVTIFKLIRN